MGISVVLAAGGTGGHLIPALAFRQFLKTKGLDVDLFVGSRSLEQSICEAHQVEAMILPLKGSPLGGGLFKAPKRMLDLYGSYRRVRKIFKAKRPDLVVVFGGYLSVPVALAASQMGLPLFAHEQNAIAGRATKMLENWGAKVLTGWPSCRGVKKFQFVGIPTRRIQKIDKAYARRELFGDKVSSEERIMLFLGGSLGSSGLAQILKGQSMVEFSSWRPCFLGLESHQVPWPGALALPSQWDMALPYAAADLVVTRAGGATLAEIAAYQLKSLVIPWTESKDNHQVANAKLFHDLTGTPWWDGMEKNQFPQRLAQAWKEQPHFEIQMERSCQRLAEAIGI